MTAEPCGTAMRQTSRDLKALENQRLLTPCARSRCGASGRASCSRSPTRWGRYFVSPPLASLAPYQATWLITQRFLRFYYSFCFKRWTVMALIVVWTLCVSHLFPYYTTPIVSETRPHEYIIGRPQTTLEDVPALFLRHYPSYKAGQLNVSELARVCDLSRTTTYKYIGLLEGSTAIRRWLRCWFMIVSIWGVNHGICIKWLS